MRSRTCSSSSWPRTRRSPAKYIHMRNALEPLPTRMAQQPSDLENLGSIGACGSRCRDPGRPRAATLAHTLLTSVRRRRKSIALLRSMGFARRQVSAVVMVQALTLVLIALVIGIALGLVGGRIAWNALRRQPRADRRAGPAVDRAARAGAGHLGARRGGRGRAGIPRGPDASG